MLAIATVLLAGGLAAAGPPPASPGEVTGRLTGAERGPKARIVILLLAIGAERVEEKAVTPDKTGRFRMELPPATYHAAFRSVEALSRIYPGLVVRPGCPVGLGDVPLSKSIRVRVAVRDASSHEPVAGADLSWDPQAGANSQIARSLYSKLWSGTTRKDGSFDVRVAAGMPLGWKVEAAQHQLAAVASPALDASPSRTVNLTVDLKPSLSLKVDVEPPPDLLLKGATVTVAERIAKDFRFRDRESRPAELAAIVFHGLAEGAKRCLLRDSAGRILCYSDIELSADGQEVVLAPHGVRIHGVVKRGESPVSGAVVKVGVRFDPRGEADAGTSDPTGEDGAYEIRTYQTGEIQLKAGFPFSPGKVGPFESKAITLSLEDTEREADFEFPPGRLRLSVIDSKTRMPVPGARVELTTSGGPGEARTLMTSTDESGRLVLEGFPTGPAKVAVSAERHRRKEASIEIDEEPPEAVIALDPAAALEGHVVDSRGEPVPGTNVMWAQGLGVEGVDADESGHFEIQTAPEGGQTFFFSAPGHSLGMSALSPENDNLVALSDPGPPSLVILGVDGLPASRLNLSFAPRGGAKIPGFAISTLATMNGFATRDFVSTTSGGAAPFTSFLPPGAFEVFVVTRSENGGPRFELVGTLPVPSTPPTILTYDPESGPR